jgi:multicomponent Na+:H+ antiporter subunit E
MNKLIKPFKKIISAAAFIYSFAMAFILSNFSIAISILFQPIKDMYPNIITLNVTKMTRREVIMLSHCITLTPGTTTIKVDNDFNTLYIHCFNGLDPAGTRESIYKQLAKPIMRLARW